MGTARNSRPSLERRVLTGTGLQLAARVVTAVASASTILLLGRHLDDAALGVFNYHFSIFLVLGALVDFGSMAIAVRESSRDPDREAAVIRAAFRLRVFFASGCFALYAVIAWLDTRSAGGGARLALLLLGAASLFATAPCAAAAWLHTRVQLRAIALAPILGYGLYLGGCAAAIAAGVREPGAFVAILGAGLTVQSLVPWIAARSHVQLLGALSGSVVRDVLRAMAPLGISAAISTLYFRLDALLLRQLIGPEANGLYTRAFPMLSLSIALPGYLSAALLPALTRSFGSGSPQLLRLVRRACAVLGAFALPAAAMCFGWGAQVLWLFWARHAQGQSLAAFRAANGELIRCVPWLAIAAIAIFLTIPQMHALTAMGRQRVLARIALCALIGKLALAPLAIRTFGVPGAAMATAATESGVLAWVSFEVRHAAGGFALGRALLRPLVVAAPIGLVAALLPDLAPLAAVGAAIGLEAAAVLVAGGLPLRLGIDD